MPKIIIQEHEYPEIVQQYINGRTHLDIAEGYGVSQTTIGRILKKRGITSAHIVGERVSVYAPRNKTRLTKEDIRLIKAAVAERKRLDREANKLLREAASLSNRSLARKFDISPTTVNYVANNIYHYASAKK
jgi:DNA-directed RNA polymerase specialized sigma24 family protein